MGWTFNSEKSIVKLYYDPIQVCKMLDISQSCLRFWYDNVICNPARRDNGRRIYDKKTVAKLHLLKTLLRVDKYTIEGAKQKLKQMQHETL